MGGRGARRARQDLGEIYEQHVWTVYGFIGYRVGSREEAEDLTQLTFERALRAFGRFNPERASAATWLLAIARNIVIDHYRRDRTRARASLVELPDAHPELVEPGPELSRLGLDHELEAALGRLGDRDREVLALRFGGDLRAAEIAELTGLSLANVQQILSRSLRRLRAELEQRGSVTHP